MHHIDIPHPLIAEDLVTSVVSHVSLDSAPSYSALSYTWGSPDRRRNILLDGALFSITEDLETALHHLLRYDNQLIHLVIRLS